MFQFRDTHFVLQVQIYRVGIHHIVKSMTEADIHELWQWFNISLASGFKFLLRISKYLSWMTEQNYREYWPIENNKVTNARID